MITVPESLRTYRADLVEAIDRELAHTRRDRHLERRLLFAGVAVAAVALLALTVAEPWRGSPTILERARAALLAPGGGQILYESLTAKWVSASGPPRAVMRVRLWLDSAPPHRFRMTFSGARPAEVGGTIGSSRGLYYNADGNVLYRAAFQFRVRQSDLDPAAFIRAALSSGRAKLLGKAAIRGRDVILIQLPTWFDPPLAVLYYVDADTYRPVRVVVPPLHGRGVILPATSPRASAAGHKDMTGSSLGFPMDPGAFLAGFPGYPGVTLRAVPSTSAPGVISHRVYDFGQYQLLAPTPANRRLTSVRAMRFRS